MPRPPAPRGRPEKLLRVAGLPAVQALFRNAPARVERLFFTGDLRRAVDDYCGIMARARKPYRQVGAEELAPALSALSPEKRDEVVKALPAEQQQSPLQPV